MLLRYLIIIIASCSIITSCNKDKEAEPINNTPQGNAKAIVINNTTDSIRLTLSGTDLTTGSIPHILTLTLAPSDTTIIARNDLKDATKYIYNWQSDNYTFSDWFLFNGSSKAKYEFDYLADSTDYILTIPNKKRNDLLICLNGTAISSTWQTVNAFDANGASVWSGLNNRERSHSFIINQFHTVKHNYIDTSNNTQTSLLAFALHDSSANFSLNTTQIDKYILSNNISFVAPLSTQSLDTLFYCRYSVDSNSKVSYQPPYYQIVKTSIDE